MRKWMFLKVAGLTLGVVGMSGVLAAPIFEYKLLRDSTSQYVSSSENVYKIELRGGVIFTSREIYFVHSMLFPASAVIALLGGGLLSSARRRNDRD